VTGAGTGARRSRAGALLCAGLLAVVVTAVVARHGAPVGPDLALHRWVLRHRWPALTAAAVALTTTGTGVPAYVVAGLAGAAGRARARRLRGAATAVAALALGQAVRVALAGSVGRPRPPVSDWAWHAGGPALPSGHTTTSALVAVLVCLAVTRLSDSPRRRAVGCALALLWAAAVGLTRGYLGVHWPSDVVAGWLLAATLALLARSLRRQVGAVHGSASAGVDPAAGPAPYRRRMDEPPRAGRR